MGVGPWISMFASKALSIRERCRFQGYLQMERKQAEREAQEATEQAGDSE